MDNTNQNISQKEETPIYEIQYHKNRNKNVHSVLAWLMIFFIFLIIILFLVSGNILIAIVMSAGEYFILDFFLRLSKECNVQIYEKTIVINRKIYPIKEITFEIIPLSYRARRAKWRNAGIFKHNKKIVLYFFIGNFWGAELSLPELKFIQKLIIQIQEGNLPEAPVSFEDKPEYIRAQKIYMFKTFFFVGAFIVIIILLYIEHLRICR